MDEAWATTDPESAIPDKLFFRIGEVSEIVGVEPYVLRYWESEFRGLSPKKSSTGQRMFRRRDVELLIEIKRLLYTHKFTIAGARRILKEKVETKNVTDSTQSGLEQNVKGGSLPAIRREIEDIVKMLAN